MLTEFLVKTEISYTLDVDTGLHCLSFNIDLPNKYIWFYNSAFLRNYRNRKRDLRYFLNGYKREGCKLIVTKKNGFWCSKIIDRIVFLKFSDIEKMIGRNNTEGIEILNEIKTIYETFNTRKCG